MVIIALFTMPNFASSSKLNLPKLMFIFGVWVLLGLVGVRVVGGGVFLSLAEVLAVFLVAGVILLVCGVVGAFFLTVWGQV